MVSHPLFLLFVGVVVLGVLYIATMTAAVMAGKQHEVLEPLAALVGAVAGWWAYRRLVRTLEQREADELGLSGAWAELAAGLALGGTLFCTATAGVAALGGFRIEGLRGIGNLSEMLAVAIFSGFYEEVIFRGVLMRHLESVIGTLGALAATALFFGLAHLANPGASLGAALAIAVEAGVLLGAAWLVTRRLWLAIGIHAAWNFTQGWIFSIPVSGTGQSVGLLVTVRQGPEWLTGGTFGLEASVLAIAVAGTAGLWMLRRASAAGELRPPRWRMAVPGRQTKL